MDFWKLFRIFKPTEQFMDFSICYKIVCGNMIAKSHSKSVVANVFGLEISGDIYFL